MRDIVYILADWSNLINLAQNEYVFGEPMDVDLFRKYAQEAAEYFALGKESKKTFGILEIKLYGLIRGYSCIPVVTEGEYTFEFEASLRVAETLAEAILQPQLYRFEGSKMIEEYVVDGIKETKVYDFETGDLSDFSYLDDDGFKTDDSYMSSSEEE